jgi:tight adherence protein C
VSFAQRYLKKFASKFTKIISNVLPKDKAQKNNAKTAAVERQLRLAGVFMSAQEFNSIKLVVMLASVALFAVLSVFVQTGLKNSLEVLLVGVIIGVEGPTFFLKSKVKGHQQKIRDQLPDAMDLLGVCIEAGLSFDISLIKVAEKLKGPFIDELLIVHREIQMGRTRREALQHLSDSTEIPELKTFTSALAQAEQLGIPIINVMRVQSVQLRAARKQIAQEKGMKSPVKMLIPMVAFIFPVLFIILLGPTVINMIHQFKM